MKPVLIFDGDCGICRYWINYWQKLTIDEVDYQPYQEVATDYPGIPLAEFERSIQLVLAEDKIFSGAKAVYYLLRRHFPYNILHWLYLYLPGFHGALTSGRSRPPRWRRWRRRPDRDRARSDRARAA